jgi:hypothetical protein
MFHWRRGNGRGGSIVILVGASRIAVLPAPRGSRGLVASSSKRSPLRRGLSHRARLVADFGEKGL